MKDKEPKNLEPINPLSFGLSEDKKIPSIKFFGYAIWPWKIPRVLKWNFYKDGGGNICLVRKGSGGKFITNLDYAKLTVMEWDSWLSFYKLPKKLEISKILDVGSATGETMFFYDQVYGIKNFIGVEIDSEKARLNRKNIKLHDWNAKIYNEAFKLEHFKEEDFDFAKIDCEGGERVLVGEEIDIPMVVEVHNEKLKRKFEEMGFKFLTRSGARNKCFMMNNFREVKEEDG